MLTSSPLGGGWLSGAFRKGHDTVSDRAALMPGLFDILAPANAGKLDAVEQLAALADEAGLTPIHLTLGFVLSHRAVTAPIIGPLNIEQLDSQLAAADLTLESDVLDAIDAIVAPGRNMTDRDAGYVPPELNDPALRRRQS